MILLVSRAHLELAILKNLLDCNNFICSSNNGLENNTK